MTRAARYWFVALLLLGMPSRSQDGSRIEGKREGQKSQDFLFEVQPREIVEGEAALLRWSIKGATKVVIEEAPVSGNRDLRKLGTFEGSSGTLEVRPRENTTYVVTCEGSTTYSCASATVRVRVKRR